MGKLPLGSHAAQARDEYYPDLGDPDVIHREFFRNSLKCHHCGYTNYANWKVQRLTRQDVIKPRRKCAKCGRQLHLKRDANLLRGDVGD